MKPRLALLGLLLGSFVACDDKTPSFWLPANQLLSPVALDNQVAFVEVNSHTAFLVDPGDPALRPRPVRVGENPVLAQKRNGRNQLLVLSRGNPGSAAKAPVSAQLQIVDGTQAPSPAPLVLPSRFDRLIQSEDGEYAILFHSSAKDNSGDAALFNPNEIIIVELTSLAANPRTIRSLGGAPDAVIFSPALSFRSSPRRLAVVLAQNYITLLDLANPTRTEISVPLCAQAGTCLLHPEQVVFGPNPLPDPDPIKDLTKPRAINIFVRASSAADIFQVTLTELLGADLPAPPGNDFRATLSMLAVGSVATDMTVFLSQASTSPRPDTDTRLLVAAPSARSLLVIDPKTTDTTTVPTTMPVSKVVAYTLPAAQSKNQALLLDTSGNSAMAAFANLDMIETAGPAALAPVALPGTASEANFFPGENLVVLMFGKSGGGTALAVVDLATRSVSPMSPNTNLADLTFDINGLGSRLWGAIPNAKLFYLNLAARGAEPRLYVGTVWIDQSVSNILPMTAASSLDGRRYLVLLHNDPGSVGNITVLDADVPDRATARSAYGFLFTDYLERGQP